MNDRTKAEARVQARRGTFGRTWGWAALLAAVSLGVAAGGCNLLNDYGNAWANAEATSAGAGGNMCAGLGGYGGEGGGDDEGAGGDNGSGIGGSSGVSVGAGGSSGDTVGASVGAGAGDARSGWAEGHAARAPHHHRGRRGGLGTAQQAGCPGMTPPVTEQGGGNDAALLLGYLQDANDANPLGGVSCSNPSDCSTKCFAASKYCVEHAVHPYKPPMVGDLFNCIDSFPPASAGGSYTCLYRYPNSDACIFARAAKLGPITLPAPPPLCVYKSP